jgi:hypothetical protein
MQSLEDPKRMDTLVNAPLRQMAEVFCENLTSSS